MTNSIIAKQSKRRTTITLKKPTTEINISPNVACKNISQDALGRIYINLKHLDTNKLDNY